uniref:DALR anticodon-binding domain-containing protein 3 isoform X2 n=1 Tax=Myxine glutinosa TaxID=7769 RepID=UPI00358FA3A9
MVDASFCPGPVLVYKARLQELLLQHSQKSKIVVSGRDCHTQDVDKGAVGPTRDGTSTEPRVYVESCRRNILHRDLLVPSGSLCHLFGQPQPPQELIQAILKLQEPGLPRVLSCNNTKAGLAISFDHTDFLNHLLSPSQHAVPYRGGKGLVGDLTVVVLTCPCIGQIADPNDLPLSSLRAVLLAHHVGKLLKRKGYQVVLTPPLRSRKIADLLHFLRVDWPTYGDWKVNMDDLPMRMQGTAANLPDEDILIADLKKKAEHYHCCTGKDDNIATSQDETEDLETGVKNLGIECKPMTPTAMWLDWGGLGHWKEPRTVGCVHESEDDRGGQRMKESSAERKEECSRPRCAQVSSTSRPSWVINIISSVHGHNAAFKVQHPGMQDEALQLLVGSVNVAGSSGEVFASDYIRHREAEVARVTLAKHDRLTTGSDVLWKETIEGMTVAAVKFELLSTAHQTPITLQMHSGIATWRGRGTFVMYNSARLGTLFANYRRGRRNGIYPDLPKVSSLDYMLLREEGEWKLLFNYVAMLEDLLDSAVVLSRASGETRTLVANTDTVCKFLWNLSKDFSAYYSRIHILGEPRAHLMPLMFVRLRFLLALWISMEEALDTLGLPTILHA